MNKSIMPIIIVLLFVVFCSCNSFDSKNCEIQKIKTLFTTSLIYEGNTTYGHHTLVKGFPRHCLDSATMVNLALNYCDTVKVGKPVSVIMFFNSEKDFIPNETSQVIEEINKSCLVVIGLDIRAKKPNDFIFYNEKGERLYWGPEWKPLGK